MESAKRLLWEAPPFAWDIFANCPIPSLITERASGLIIDANEATARALGLDRCDVIGQQLFSFMVDPSDLPPQVDLGSVTRRFLHADGFVMRLVVVVAELPDAPELASIMLIDSAAMSPTLARDDLTGLSTRDAMRPALDRALAHRSDRAAVAFIDLDDFKAVNDSGGHLLGDEILRAAAHAIRSVVRSVDTAIRFGGDEFVIVFPGVNTAYDLRWITSRICAAIRHATSDTGWEVTASIGVALTGTGTEADTEVLHFADQAMYKAKAAGGDQAHIEILI